MQCIVNLEAFDGPLDLLLHLIKKMDVDIYDISIDEIARQYLEYINGIDASNLDDASDYLVMAAELLGIKARSLLPSSLEETEDTELEDYRENLIDRLVQYKNYKDLTQVFDEMHDGRFETFTKEAENINNIIERSINLDDEVTVFMLSDALRKLMVKEQDKKPLDTKITNKDYSITRRSEEIKEYLLKKKKANFTELFDNFNKNYIIVTFLSILNLSRKDIITLEQEKNFDNIIVSMKEQKNE